MTDDAGPTRTTIREAGRSGTTIHDDRGWTRTTIHDDRRPRG